MKNLLKFSFMLIAFVFASCGDDDDAVVVPAGASTISEFVSTNPDYSALAAALEITNLTATLDSEGPFTVFAPNNAAFATFLNANGFASLEDVPVDVLTNTLLNHVVSGTNNAADLTTGYVNSLAVFGATERNLSLFIDLTSGVKINGVSTVTAADVPVSNGVIHAVDTVIAIPTVVTQALANPAAFSTLVDALVAGSDTTTDYVALLSGTTASPFTVFAPTNDAFSGLLSSLGLDSVNDVPQGLLQSILNYHVIAGANVQSSDLTDGQIVPTFQGENITISLANGAQVIDATGMPANIVVVDVQTGNGVIHALDKVLLPQAVIDVLDPTIAGLAMMTPDLSSLAEALQITGLDVVLNDRNAEFTVFAPTNLAFETFLAGTPLSDVAVPVLTQILLNHALTGVVLSTDLSTSYTNTLATFNGEVDAPLSLYVNTDNGVKLNGISNVSTPDVTASNGVVHIVDAVIALPTVVTFAAADAATFSELVGALTRADQPDYLSVLTTGNGTDPAPFTVFAPTNQAVADLYDELGAGVTNINDIDGPTLTAALNTHVIAGANVRAEDLVDGTQSTLGDDIVIDAANAIITDPNGRTSQIIVTNVQAANGVIHAIQTVLLPQL
ncbi:MAG: transforming growth factor-beta-induced protein [Patiriisocius sp.]|jgi:transforming growth factor-beta-induced protein